MRWRRTQPRVSGALAKTIWRARRPCLREIGSYGQMLFNDGFIEFADIALGDNVASIHDVKTVANVHAEIEILFDEQNANFAFTSKLLNSVANLLEALFAGVVETVRPKFFDGFADLVDNVGLDALGRLVQEQHFWIGEQGPANGELLLLAS